MSTAALPEDATPALSEAQRLLYTFTAPSRTMADLRRNASWWVPWLLISVVSMAFVYALDKRVGWGQVMETQVQANPKSAEKMDKMPPEQREKIMKIQETSARVIGYAAPGDDPARTGGGGWGVAGTVQLWVRHETDASRS